MENPMSSEKLTGKHSSFLALNVHISSGETATAAHQDNVRVRHPGLQNDPANGYRFLVVHIIQDQMNRPGNSANRRNQFGILCKSLPNKDNRLSN